MRIIAFNYGDQSHRNMAFEIRRKVFIEEQEVEEKEEFDEFEKTALHYLVFIEGKAAGTARWRISEKGVKLERFAVLKEHRKVGLGKSLLSRMLLDVPSGFHRYLHAQEQVVPFYQAFGFEQQGSSFMECDILHFYMSMSPEIANNLSLQRTIQHVQDFHEAFALPVGKEPSVAVSKELIQLRYNLMKEENEEYLEAALAGDLVEVADALGDMLYILNGSILTHGMQSKIEAVYEEIQRSNMSKLDKDGQPIYREDGKVLKSDLYFKPEIEKILKAK